MDVRCAKECTCVLGLATTCLEVLPLTWEEGSPEPNAAEYCHLEREHDPVLCRERNVLASLV